MAAKAREIVLVDTSVWIEHLRVGLYRLRELMESDRLYCHPFVIGELACGIMPHREEILERLGRLPSVDVVDHKEAMALLNMRRLAGRGLSWIDVHLLASALVSNVGVWTLDRHLLGAARTLGLTAT